MVFLMSCQVPGPGERLATLGANINLSSMYILVFFQTNRLEERLVTVRTAKGLFSFMNSLVCLQVTRLGEKLIALSAGKDLSSMGVILVCLKAVIAFKRLFTFRACKGSCCMRLLVCF